MQGSFLLWAALARWSVVGRQHSKVLGAGSCWWQLQVQILVWTKGPLPRSLIFAALDSLVFLTSRELPVALNSQDPLTVHPHQERTQACKGAFGGSQAGRCSSMGGLCPSKLHLLDISFQCSMSQVEWELCTSDVFRMGRLRLQHWLWAAPSTCLVHREGG